MSVESIQKFQETKFKDMLLMETVQKYPQVKLKILPINFSRHARKQNHQIVPMKKKSGSKVSNLVRGKFHKIQEVKFENLTHENLASFWEMSSQKCVE